MDTTQIERIRRMEALFDESGESLRRLEQARQELEQARQELEQARQELEQARQNLEQVRRDVKRARLSFEQAGRDVEAMQPVIAELEAYYASPDWRADFEADEAGRLPADLKRGVLSEDGLYNLLEKYEREKGESDECSFIVP